MLSLDHLSPSTVTPRQLQSLLVQIKTKLPSSLKLPEDPEKNIWYFYRVLACSTILDGDKILVIVNIPLLDYHGEFEVFKVHSIAVPPHQKLSKSSGLSDMVARYDTECPGILINKDRSQYALLNSEELQTCGSPKKYCSPKNAVLPVNLHRLCILALFFKDNKKIDKYCRRVVEPNAVLPSAQYISSGNWVVSARKPLQFSIVCLSSKSRKSPMTQQTQMTTSFVDIINLKSGCHAANDYINLPPYYEFEGYRMPSYDPSSKLLEMRNRTKFRIWDPLILALPNFTAIELPQSLKTIKQIPMNDLLLQLKSLKQVQAKSNYLPVWVHILIGLSILLILLALVYICCKQRKNKQKWTPACTCLHSLARLCEMEGGSNGGKPNRRRESARVDNELAMSTLLEDGNNLACRQEPNQGEVQPSILEQLSVSRPIKTK